MLTALPLKDAGAKYTQRYYEAIITAKISDCTLKPRSKTLNSTTNSAVYYCSKSERLEYEQSNPGVCPEWRTPRKRSFFLWKRENPSAST